MRPDICYALLMILFCAPICAAMARPRISLDGEWNLSVPGKPTDYKVNVPGSWQAQVPALKDYALIEIMCCPGGCIGGGAQPQPTSEEIRKTRVAVIYDEDEHMPLRKSHENPAVRKLYEDFLGEPLSHKSHELLHTKYTPRVRRTVKKAAEEKPTKVKVE